MKSIRKVIVYEEDNEYSLPVQAEEFMAFWQEKLDKIPEEFLESAQIEVGAESDSYNCASLFIAVSYTRPETDKEESDREVSAIASQIAEEAQERRTFAKLLKKYGT